MAKEICISSTPHETRLAILEDDQLAEIYYERENEYTLAGSIYNGRVTRVLPGMQSAFVDIGLERDAFLYVTDFLELEDPEESDEVEKAASTGSTQPPREVHAAERGGSRTEERTQRSSRRQEPRADRASQERQPRDHRLVVEAATETAETAGLESVSVTEPADQGGKDTLEQGGKRWRGRRRRRGGRGSAEDAQESQAGTGASAGEDFEETSSSIAAEEIQASSLPSQRPKSFPTTEPASSGGSRGQAAPAFVLPGESLSKYGGTTDETDSKPAAKPAQPVRPSSSFKPASLIEAPLQWDGSGLLPGESISRHRGRPSEPETVAETAPTENAQAESEAGEQEAHQPAESVFAEESRAHEEHSTEEHASTSAVETAEASGPETETAESDEADASASHHVDPTAPTGFRLFGLGGKKKAEEPAAAPAPAAATPATVAAVSAYAPGAGLIEEEVMEEEEFDLPHHAHAKADDHDLEDYEEETLPTQLRSGDLGEMLQEAHLDHKIQLKFEDKNGEEDDPDDEEDDEEEEATAEGLPSGGQGQDGSQQRRERGGRGRRGRNGQSGGQGNRRGGMTRRSAQTSDLPIISDLLKPGQEILVQIAKEPIAKKGARITSHIALPGRFLVFMPTVSHIGVSRKIASDEERQRLKRILVHERGEATGGFIVRTAAEGASEEELRADLRFLIHLWDEIKQRSESSKSPALIYHDLSLIERILRDQVSANFSSIWVDSQEDYERIVRFLNRFSPTLVRRVKLYTKETPLFEHFGIQDEISKALRSKVWLKSGGSIVINQTEALVAIDINTGKYVGKSARLEDTIVKTNLDAVPEIVRQIRLRDLGGIIVIDFIDMDERKNRFRVLAALEEALKADRAPTKVLQFNDFGLVAITRKRVKQSLERTLSVPCPTCQATGMVKSSATVCNEIYIELRKMKKHFEGADVLLRVNPETVKVLKQNNAAWLNEFEELTGKNLLVKSDATLHPEQFDIQG